MNKEKEIQIVGDLIDQAVQAVYQTQPNIDYSNAFEYTKSTGKVYVHQIAFPAFKIQHCVPTPEEKVDDDQPKKKKKKKPKVNIMAVTQGLEKEINRLIQQNKPTIVDRVEAAGPYLNFFLKPGYLGLLINNILKGDYLEPKQDNKTNVMIEYSQPNTHKTFHVGHMRNAALGMSLVKLFKHQGYNVVAANYLGDVGTHIARCLWYYLNCFPNRSENIEDDVPANIKRVEFLGSCYSKACQMLSLGEYAAMPIKGFVVAKVSTKEPHPTNKKWNVVTLDVGSNDFPTVVCGGKGYNVGDMVPYAPVGAKYKKKVIAVGDKAGVPSAGFILSVKELDQPTDDNDQIKVFSEADFGEQHVVIKVSGKKEKVTVSPCLPNGRLPTPGTTLVDASRIPNTDIAESDDVLTVLAARDAEVKQLLLRLEQGEEKVTTLWNKTRQWSIDDFEDIYEWTNTEFDVWFYESQVGEEGKQICYKAFDDGILVKSGGAIGADLKSYTMPGTKRDLGFCVLITSANTGLYATKDVALAKKKFNEYKIDRSIYVVDASQSFHFQQVFKTLELLGFEQAKQCYHLAYGLVTLSSGKMSSRAGTVIFFSKLKSLLSNKIYSTFLSKYANDWDKEEIERAQRVIALATIKYGMLNQDNGKNIVFEMDDWLNPQGNTGPYMLYAYARTRSVLRKIKVSDAVKQQIDWNLLRHPNEIAIINFLREFSSIVEQACESYRPSVLTQYLYQLSKQYSRMYESVSVKYAATPALCATRLALVEAVGNVIRKGLHLLGIDTLERM